MFATSERASRILGHSTKTLVQNYGSRDRQRGTSYSSGRNLVMRRRILPAGASSIFSYQPKRDTYLGVETEHQQHVSIFRHPGTRSFGGFHAAVLLLHRPNIDRGYDQRDGLFILGCELTSWQTPSKTILIV